MDNIIKMTLHEAIQKILRDAKKPLSTSEIASSINLQRLYNRGDGSPIPASQISARIKNYPDLFRRLPNNEIELNNKAKVILDDLVFRLEDCVRGKVDRSGYLIHSILFYVRFSYTDVGYDFFKKYNFDEWVNNHKHLLQKTVDPPNFSIDNTFRVNKNTIDESSLNIKLYLKEAFKNLDTHFDTLFWKDFILEQINKASESTILNLYKIICDYDLRDESLTDEVFGAFFNEYLNSGSRSMRDQGISSTPEALNISLSKLVTLKANDVLLDPFAGFCGTIVKASLANSEVKHSLIAFDILDEAIVLGQMNLILNALLVV